MAISTRLKEFLDQHGVHYATIPHPEAYTAQEVAALTHIRGKELAKSVVVRKERDQFIMVILPASRHIDFAALKAQLGTHLLELATEGQFKQLFPDCEAGAMPPFGNLYNLPTYVDESLREDREIAFNACTHREVVRLAFADYERLAQPQFVRCSVVAAPSELK
jgi:Ala-tRNA(Pro) deacylase